MASLGTINFLGGLTNAYGRVLANNQAQGEDLARLGLQHQWQQSDQAQAQAANAARLTQQESFDTTQADKDRWGNAVNAAWTRFAGQPASSVRSYLGSIASTYGKSDKDIESAMSQFPAQLPQSPEESARINDLLAKAPALYAGVSRPTAYGALTAGGASPAQANTVLPPVQNLPGKSVTTPTAAGTAAFQATPQGGPALQPDAGVDALRNGAPGSLGAFTMDLLRGGQKPGGLMAPSVAPPQPQGPLTQTVTQPGAPDPNQLAFPLTPSEQFAQDRLTQQKAYETARLNQEAWNGLAKQIATMPPDARAKYIEGYNKQNNTSLKPEDFAGVPFVNKAGLTQADIDAKTATTQNIKSLIAQRPLLDQLKKIGVNQRALALLQRGQQIAQGWSRINLESGSIYDKAFTAATGEAATLSGQLRLMRNDLAGTELNPGLLAQYQTEKQAGNTAQAKVLQGEIHAKRADIASTVDKINTLIDRANQFKTPQKAQGPDLAGAQNPYAAQADQYGNLLGGGTPGINFAPSITIGGTGGAAPPAAAPTAVHASSGGQAKLGDTVQRNGKTYRLEPDGVYHIVP